MSGVSFLRRLTPIAGRDSRQVEVVVKGRCEGCGGQALVPGPVLTYRHEVAVLGRPVQREQTYACANCGRKAGGNFPQRGHSSRNFTVRPLRCGAAITAALPLVRQGRPPSSNSDTAGSNVIAAIAPRQSDRQLQADTRYPRSPANAGVWGANSNPTHNCCRIEIRTPHLVCGRSLR